MEIITVAEAQHRWRQALAASHHLIEYISPDQALHRVAAADIRSVHPYPPYRKSPFDGYAVHSCGACRDFTIIATIGAGQLYTGPVGPQEAIRLMTGCAVPDACDTVIMQEQAIVTGNSLHITAPFQRGSNIIPVGEECPAGARLIPQGTTLTSGAISAAVGLGNERLPVYEDIHVLLLTSGRELVLPGQHRSEGQLFNSNAFLLKGLLQEEGLQHLSFHHVTDDPSHLADEIEIVRTLAKKAHIILSTGGVSVGLYDTMPQLYEALGARRLYKRVTMRPGSASYGAVIPSSNGQPIPVLGLSGNPSAAFNAYHLLAVPVLRRLRGEKNMDFPKITCRLSQDLYKENPVDRYIQGHVTFDNGEPVFTPNQILTSSALLGLAYTNGLALIKKGTPPHHKGQAVPVLLLRRL
ncbi:MAG: molybdopterin molybdotransferase MoeA [Megasphaera sp.]|jgi:molybdopterin molybdotransferase|nr:molybdopterin molybdotransferase MoeA [Megasphaera sp.]MCH4187339.1 molybdopterin molybdotransferase MoeA [Megasphaera sp.]MCH4217521.1 molybdopterin molybdotransferase MoeA [Megasphaera sp.]